MRSRKEIEKEIRSLSSFGKRFRIWKLQRLKLELLLDIRDQVKRSYE